MSDAEKKPRMGKRGPLPRTDINWQDIELDYRAGFKSNTQLCADHGISRRELHRKVTELGWTKSLQPRIQAAADEKVAREISDKFAFETGGDAAEIVDNNAAVIANVQLRQRDDILNLRELVASLTIECKAQVKDPAVFVKLGELMASGENADVEKLNELYRRVISTHGRITSVKLLADALKTLIELERKVLKMDTDDKGNAVGIEDILRRLAENN